ncbi:MAG: hypothetical protein CSA95_09215 [Bacteroidetes bacterium]|nr:MAG: hypothetical protein CSA95_09215 [Bacteroidota bacterium]
MKRLIIAIFLLYTLGSLTAQEVIVPAGGSPSLRGPKELVKQSPKRGDTGAMVIPFFDDFYEDRIYPNPARWEGQDGFQNQDFAVFPLTQGVLTLDALDKNGHIHEQALPGPSNWIADVVTSRAIRLDSIFIPNPEALRASDSLYLSFWFQPGGGLGPHPFNDIGTPPESQDSLVLEFLAPEFADTTWVEVDTVINGVPQTISIVDHIEEAWDYVWSSEGMLLDSLITYTQEGYYFMKVMIPITNEIRYFHKDFRFRFKNYVSLSSEILPSWQNNADMWNIDYVYLDKDRTVSERGVKDLSFVNKAPSMLTKYYSMPFRQYKENYIYEMIDTIRNQIVDLDKESYNMTYKYRVTNHVGGLIYEYDAGYYVINPYFEEGYSSHAPFAKPPSGFFFPVANADSATYKITHFLSSDEALPFKGNDTTTFIQRFYNYYAYDNGTAENGYGIEGDNNGMVAVKFTLNKADTLRGINLCFNEILNTPEDQSFYLTVWNHQDRKPGEVRYQQYEMRPEPTSYRKSFHTYILDEPIVIDPVNFPNLIFYVGWQKNNDDRLLNVGYDRSRNSSANSFYCINNIWYNSIQSGTIMIRPLLGSTLPPNTGLPAEEEAFNGFEVYPNPTSGETLHLRFKKQPLPGEGRILLRNAQGKIVRSFSANREQLSIAGLPSGIYLAQYIHGSERVYTVRFLISK